MNVEDAVVAAEKLIGRGLTHVQELVFRQAWEGQSYEEIAEASGYDTGYLKDVGAKLWHSLSATFRQKTTKSNFRGLLERYQQHRTPKSDVSQEILMLSRSDPNEPANGIPFYGRETELEILTRWMLRDRCQTIAVLGIGGIGKTSLIAAATARFGSCFESVIWRSLRNAPAPSQLLSGILNCVGCSLGSENNPSNLDTQIEYLLYHFHQHRCLLVLDNAESVLESGRMRGRYRDGYEGYGQLLRCLADESHQSCLLLTSRERPIGFTIRDDLRGTLRTLRLQGLPLGDCQKILDARIPMQPNNEVEKLVARYGGHPLALKIAAANIRAFFAGKISSFLQEDIIVFGDIQGLLEQQFERLSGLERDIMYCLAIYRERASITDLRVQLGDRIAPSSLLGALGSLQGRSLIEADLMGIGQQAIVREYVAARFIEHCSREILERSPNLLARHLFPSILARSNHDRVPRPAPILKPIVIRLESKLGGLDRVDSHLKSLLAELGDRSDASVMRASKNIASLRRDMQVPEERSMRPA